MQKRPDKTAAGKPSHKVKQVLNGGQPYCSPKTNTATQDKNGVTKYLVKT